jgi:hypothetical protein
MRVTYSMPLGRLYPYHCQHELCRNTEGCLLSIATTSGSWEGKVLPHLKRRVCSLEDPHLKMRVGSLEDPHLKRRVGSLKDVIPFYAFALREARACV